MKDSQYFGLQFSLMILAGLVATAPVAKIGFVFAVFCFGIAAG